jgi:hypothetical protein
VEKLAQQLAAPTYTAEELRLHAVARAKELLRERREEDLERQREEHDALLIAQQQEQWLRQQLDSLPRQQNRLQLPSAHARPRLLAPPRAPGASSMQKQPPSLRRRILAGTVPKQPSIIVINPGQLQGLGLSNPSQLQGRGLYADAGVDMDLQGLEVGGDDYYYS